MIVTTSSLATQTVSDEPSHIHIPRPSRALRVAAEDSPATLLDLDQDQQLATADDAHYTQAA